MLPLLLLGLSDSVPSPLGDIADRLLSPPREGRWEGWLGLMGWEGWLGLMGWEGWLLSVCEGWVELDGWEGWFGLVALLPVGVLATRKSTQINLHAFTPNLPCPPSDLVTAEPVPIVQSLSSHFKLFTAPPLWPVRDIWN